MAKTVNSPFQDFYPSISPNGLSLYFESDRPGGEGAIDLWVSRRENLSLPWQTPQNLGPLINGPREEHGANFTPDGLTMYFSSDRPEGYGGLDFYVTTRTDPNDDFGWGPAENLGPPINTEDVLEAGGVFQLDPRGNITHLYFIRHPNPNHDILVSVLGPSGWETPVYVAEVNTEFHEVRPWITKDGLRMFLSSARPGGFGLRDLYLSTRASINDPWGAPVNLGSNVNTAFRDENGSVDLGDPSENTLYGFSNRPGGFGMTDIFVTSRTCPMLTVSPSVIPVGGEVTANWNGIARHPPPLIGSASTRQVPLIRHTLIGYMLVVSTYLVIPRPTVRAPSSYPRASARVTTSYAFLRMTVSHRLPSAMFSG